MWAIADARIDDRERLSRDLAAAGRPAAAAPSDVELVLASYLAWAEGCVDRLIGDFAFVVWDGPRSRLFAARDHLGVGQLHYAELRGELVLATAIDDLLLHRGVDDTLDEESVAEFLALGLLRDLGATTFRRVRRLPPAHTLTWSAGRLHIRRYWEPSDEEPLARFRTGPEYVQAFRDLLTAAVGDRLRSGPAAVQLSGGMDSTSVAATALEVLATRGARRSDLRAFTALQNDDGPESVYAELVASALDLSREVIRAASLPPLDPFGPPVPETPEPTAYYWNSLSHELAWRAAQHAPVMLTGFAGDALLHSDPRWWVDWLVHGRVVRLTRAYRDARRAAGTRPRLRPRHAVSFAAWRTGLRSPTAVTVPEWLDPGFVARSGLSERLAARGPAALANVRELATEPVWANSFTTADPSFTGIPVRFSHPLIDIRLVRFAQQLPPDPWLLGKHILREAMQDRLPDEIRRRPKTPLGPVPRPGAGGDALARVIAMVEASPAADRFIDRARLRASLQDFARPERRRDHYRLGLSVGLIQWMSHR